MGFRRPDRFVLRAHAHRTSILLFALLTITVASAQADTANASRKSKGSGAVRAKMINGTPANRGDWPFLARVFTNSGACSGSLVSPTRVLTAAHCFVADDATNLVDPRPVSVVVGDTSTNSERRRGFRARRVWLPREYNRLSRSNFMPDIAVIELIDAVPSSLATPVRVANRLTPLNPSAPLYQAGFGQISWRGTSTTQAMEIRSEIMSDAECRSRWTAPRGGDFLCAVDRSNRTSVCFGDSGGPAVELDHAGLILVGVLAVMSTTCDPDGAIAGYTEVGPFTDIIARLPNEEILNVEPPTVTGERRVAYPLTCNQGRWPGSVTMSETTWEGSLHDTAPDGSNYTRQIVLGVGRTLTLSEDLREYLPIRCSEIGLAPVESSPSRPAYSAQAYSAPIRSFTNLVGEEVPAPVHSGAAPPTSPPAPAPEPPTTAAPTLAPEIIAPNSIPTQMIPPLVVGNPKQPSKIRQRSTAKRLSSRKRRCSARRHTKRRPRCRSRRHLRLAGA